MDDRDVRPERRHRRELLPGIGAGHAADAGVDLRQVDADIAAKHRERQPGGAHPSYAHGYYKRDNAFYIAWDDIARERDGFLAWMQANVLDKGPEVFAEHAHRLKAKAA